MADYKVKLCTPQNRRRINKPCSVWRPLVDVVESYPISVCDSRSLRREDLVACDMIYPHITTEIYHILHNKNQQWYYLPAQQRDEVLLMKTFDSDLSVCMLIFLPL